MAYVEKDVCTKHVRCMSVEVTRSPTRVADDVSLDAKLFSDVVGSVLQFWNQAFRPVERDRHWLSLLYHLKNSLFVDPDRHGLLTLIANFGQAA